MSEHAWQAITGLIAAIPSSLAAWTAYLAYKSSRMNAASIQKTNKTIGVVADKVEEVYKATNSATDKLVAATEKEAHARGVAEANAAMTTEAQK